MRVRSLIHAYPPRGQGVTVPVEGCPAVGSFLLLYSQREKLIPFKLSGMAAIEPLTMVRVKFLVDQTSQTLLVADFRDIRIGELHCLLDRLREGDGPEKRRTCYAIWSLRPTYSFVRLSVL